MAIIEGPTTLTGEVGVKPVLKRMVTTDSLSTITTAGYLNRNLTDNLNLQNSDLLLVIYDYVKETDSGTREFFNVSITGGVITLTANASSGNVVLPTTAGYVPKFSDTTGTIENGYLPSNSGGTIFSIVSGGTSVSGHLAKFADTTGTIVDLGASLFAGVTAAYGGGGTQNAFTVSGLPASAVVVATIKTSTNAVSITKAVATADTLTIDFSADPGASTTVSYVAFSTAV